MERIRESVGGDRRVLPGDWNAHYVRWLLEGRTDLVGRVMDQWVTNLVAKVLRSKEHTFERHCGEGVIVCRIDFVIPS